MKMTKFYAYLQNINAEFWFTLVLRCHFVYIKNCGIKLNKLHLRFVTKLHHNIEMSGFVSFIGYKSSSGRVMFDSALSSGMVLIRWGLSYTWGQVRIR